MTRHPITWQHRAACKEVDPAVFFPGVGEPVLAAKEYCNECQVRETCAAWALTYPEVYGVWGGLSPRDRRQERQHRGLKTALPADHDWVAAERTSP